MSFDFEIDIVIFIERTRSVWSNKSIEREFHAHSTHRGEYSIENEFLGRFSISKTPRISILSC